MSFKNQLGQGEFFINTNREEKSHEDVLVRAVP